MAGSTQAEIPSQLGRTAVVTGLWPRPVALSLLACFQWLAAALR